LSGFECLVLEILRELLAGLFGFRTLLRDNPNLITHSFVLLAKEGSFGFKLFLFLTFNLQNIEIVFSLEGVLLEQQMLKLSRRRSTLLDGCEQSNYRVKLSLNRLIHLTQSHRLRDFREFLFRLLVLTLQN